MQLNELQERLSYNINVASFILGLLNYQENLTQSDKDEILQNSQKAADIISDRIENHLINQDEKIDRIEEKIDEILKILQQ